MPITPVAVKVSLWNGWRCSRPEPLLPQRIAQAMATPVDGRQQQGEVRDELDKADSQRVDVQRRGNVVQGAEPRLRQGKRLFR